MTIAPTDPAAAMPPIVQNLHRRGCRFLALGARMDNTQCAGLAG